MFTHLHLHTEYSLLDGLSRIPDVMDRVQAIGQQSVAMTDHGALYGAIDFYKEARARGIKPIIGIEAYVAPESRLKKSDSRSNNYFHLTLLAKNAEGYRNLLGRSVSMTHMHVLATLRAGGPMRMSELARQLDVSLANATGIVTRMEERDLVERGRDPSDRRVVTVALSAAGRDAFGEMDTRSRAFFTNVLRELSPAELSQVRDSMRALFRAARTVVGERTSKEQMDR